MCSANTSEEIDSSPAVGPILSGGGYGIAKGTGSYRAETTGMTGDAHRQGLRHEVTQIWSTTLDGFTGGSPALADIQRQWPAISDRGNSEGNGAGTVWALDPNGQVQWSQSALGSVYGSVTTADFGEGYQDVIAPTIHGIEILDGKTGQEVADFDDSSGNAGVPIGEAYGFQNAPLVTDDSNGTIGITVAGYSAVMGSNYAVQGTVQHFEVSVPNGGLADENGAWPQFHHDAQLTGFVGGGATLGNWTRPDAAQNGYHRRFRRWDLRLRAGLLRTAGA